MQYPPACCTGSSGHEPAGYQVPAAAVLLMLQSGSIQLYRMAMLVFASVQVVSVCLQTSTGDRAGPLVAPLPSEVILPVCLQSSVGGREVLTCDEAHPPSPGGRSVLSYPTGRPPHPWGAAMALGLPHLPSRSVQMLVESLPLSSITTWQVWTCRQLI